MKTNRWGRVLRRCAFLATLAGAATAALAPDWNRHLKAEGYYGTVDLSLDILPTAVLQAGRPFDLLLTAHNAGPDDAHRPRVIATVRGDVNFTSSSGCTNEGAGFPQCWLPGPLPAGTQEDYLLHAQVAPTARGDFWFAAALSADDDELTPGDKIQIYRGTIVAAEDLRSQVSCTPPAQHRTLCTIRFRNAGPAAARGPRTFVYLGGPIQSVVWSCSAVRDGLCGPIYPNSTSIYGAPDWLLPNEEVVYLADIGFMPLPDYYWSTMFSASARIDAEYSETDTDWTNNSADSGFEVSLFRDDFEALPETAAK